MSSTSLKNSPGDYKLQQRMFENISTYNNYAHGSSGSAYTNAMPDMGITPSNMPRCAFSNNSVDIESALKGIGSTNLVNPQKPIVPELKNISNVAFFDRMCCVMPKPLEIAKNQRPYPI